MCHGDVDWGMSEYRWVVIEVHSWRVSVMIVLMLSKEAYEIAGEGEGCGWMFMIYTQGEPGSR